MRPTIAIFTCLLILQAGVAHAITGNDIFDQMKSGDFSEKLATDAYVRGFLDSNFLYESILSNNSVRPIFCVPAGVRTSQAVDVLRNYLERHPHERHKDASILLAISLKSAFPCR